MKTFKLLACGCLLSAASLWADVPKVIFDTDMYTDFDDVGALAVLHTLADAGECEILGTVVSTRKAPSVGMVELINRHYGRGALPLGAPRGLGVGLDVDPNAAKNASFKIYDDLVRNHSDLRHRTSDDVPDANETYRKLLAGAPDGSVTIVTVGFTTNLRRLLETRADALSPLDGRALVAKKVKAWYAMACRFPDGREYNSATDGESSKIAFAEWPSPVYFLDFVYGADVRCGIPASRLPAGGENPVRDVFARALRDYKEVDRGHSSWDEITVLAAVRGWQAYFGVERGRFEIVDAKGANHWVKDPNGRHYVLTVKTPKDQVGKIVDELIARGPMDWIDGRALPIEGRAYDDVAQYYHRLPAYVITNMNVNGGVRSQLSHSSGMSFRFKSNAKRMILRWDLISPHLAMPHMPATGVSGIDVYGWSAEKGWQFQRNGRPTGQKGNELKIDWWEPGRPMTVYLPLYNGVDSFRLGVPKGTKIEPAGPRASGIAKPVVFYGTSITHGGCASRPGLGWVNVAGRKGDFPIVGLGFSGSGRMEIDLAPVIARIDASCYVLDCLWNMGDDLVEKRFEPFVRELRRLRPDVPVVCAEDCSTFRTGLSNKAAFAKKVVEKLQAEGDRKISFLPNTQQMLVDGEETVDGCHPNDWGMLHMGEGFARAVRAALGK